MLYDTTTYYTLQAYGEILRAGPGPARPGARWGRNSALCGPWRRFPGSAALSPCPRQVSGFLGAPARFGWVVWWLSSSDVAMLASSTACRPFFLAFNLAAFQLAQVFEVGHGLGKPLSLLNRFCGLSAAAMLDRCAGGEVTAGAACRAFGKPVLAAGQARLPGGGAGKAGGTPQGCPAEGAGRRRRRRGGARSAEGRRARRALRWFGLRYRLSFPPIGAANYQ